MKPFTQFIVALLFPLWFCCGAMAQSPSPKADQVKERDFGSLHDKKSWVDLLGDNRDVYPDQYSAYFEEHEDNVMLELMLRTIVESGLAAKVLPRNLMGNGGGESKMQLRFLSDIDRFKVGLSYRF